MSNIDEFEGLEGRKHFIVEWARYRQKRQVDIVKDLEIDKGVVSRWFKNKTTPGKDHLVKLAAYFGAEEPASLFRHPQDDWLAKFFRDKTEEQKESAIDMLKIFFRENIANVDDDQLANKRQR